MLYSRIMEHRCGFFEEDSDSISNEILISE